MTETYKTYFGFRKYAIEQSSLRNKQPNLKITLTSVSHLVTVPDIDTRPKSLTIQIYKSY